MINITNKKVGKLKDIIENPCDILDYAYDQKMQNGYVSRTDGHEEFLNRIIYEASGKRKGEYFYLAPCYSSSRYCYRIYITLK